MLRVIIIIIIIIRIIKINLRTFYALSVYSAIVLLVFDRRSIFKMDFDVCERLVGQSVGESVSQSVGRSVSRSVGQSVGRSVGRSQSITNVDCDRVMYFPFVASSQSLLNPSPTSACFTYQFYL
jgi:hypothetical protein